MHGKAAHPNCLIIAGSNGAGKTTFATEFLPLYVNCRHSINPDQDRLPMLTFSSSRRKETHPEKSEVRSLNCEFDQSLVTSAATNPRNADQRSRLRETLQTCLAQSLKRQPTPHFTQNCGDSSDHEKTK